jgi:hypothetical protein
MKERRRTKKLVIVRLQQKNERPRRQRYRFARETRRIRNTGKGEMKYRRKLGIYTASPLNTLEGKVH